MSDLKVTFSAPERVSTDGIAHIYELSTSQKVVKASLRGVIGIIISGIFIAFPLLHLILVPLGLITTIIIVIAAFNQTAIISGGDAICPYCAEPISLVRRSFKFPFLERCPSCSRESQVTITKIC